MSGIWYGELMDTLRELSSKAMSGAQIAAEINSKFDTNFSRNAVIGARHRAGLTTPDRSTWSAEQRAAHNGGGHRANAGRKPTGRGEWQRLKPAGVETYRDAPAIEDMAIPFAQREQLDGLTSRNCHWPVGDPRAKEFFFCGAVAVRGRPYCGSHCKVAYIKPPRRENPNFRLQPLGARY